MRDQTDSRTLPLSLGIPGIEVTELFPLNPHAWTLKLTHCPKCNSPLSNTSYEAYCANDGCLWNNEENGGVPAGPAPHGFVNA